MSEYQYYEFQAVDRPLTREEMAELRSFSTRATITPTSFQNEYNWGSFKGDTDDWMERYFDAFLYYANWGTKTLMLRLPKRALGNVPLELYSGYEEFSYREVGPYVILTANLEDDPDDFYMEDEPALASLIGMRHELASGDYRPLYLGWLLGATWASPDDDEPELEPEPPVPPGLDDLSGPQSAFVEFFGVDEDLLAVAAAASPKFEAVDLSADSLRRWIAQQPGELKEEWLMEFISSNDRSLATELRALAMGCGQAASPPATGRTASQLAALASERREERLRRDKEREAEEAARKEREAAAAREEYLDGIAGREATLWNRVNALIAERKPKTYDEAVGLIADLRDLAERASDGDFWDRLSSLRVDHAGKPTLMERLNKKGLVPRDGGSLFTTS
jgi:hypothetical protein